MACAQRLLGLGVDVILLEAGPRVGGKIRTIEQDGYQFEAGPNTLITNRQPMLDLIAEVEMEGEIVDGSPDSRRRWISMGSALCPLPTGLLGAITSPLLGPGTIARALGDLFLRRPGRTDPPESVAEFVDRHFGARVLDNLVSPFLSGVYAGDSSRLEARSVLPMLVEAEEARGSVIRGMIAARRAARRAGTPKLPMRSITFRAGLESLARRIAEVLGSRLRLNTSVAALSEEDGGCRVTLGDGEHLVCDRVVIAGGAKTAAELIQDLPGSGSLAAALRAIPHAGLSMVGLAYPRAVVPHPLDGFGYLNGPGATGPVLGCLFRSSLFPHVAPPDKALLVAFIGGARHPGYAEQDEDRLVALARQELEERLGITAPPERVFIHRWPAAIPQYVKGHWRVRTDAERWGEGRNVSVVGSTLTGLSLNDCACAGRAEAERLGLLLKCRAGAGKGELCPSA